MEPKNEQLEWNAEEPKSKSEEEYAEMPPPTSVTLLEKTEKTGTISFPFFSCKLSLFLHLFSIYRNFCCFSSL